MKRKQRDDVLKQIMRRETSFWERIRPKLMARIHFLLFKCQFDIVKFINFFLLCGMGAILFMQPDYLQSSATLLQLRRIGVEWQWGIVLTAVGLSELFLLFTTGNDPLLATTPRQALAWQQAGLWGFRVCLFLFFVLALLLTPPMRSSGWGNVLLGLPALLSGYGMLRTAKTIAVQAETIRYEAIAASVESDAGPMKTIAARL